MTYSQFLPITEDLTVAELIPMLTIGSIVQVGLKEESERGGPVYIVGFVDSTKRGVLTLASDNHGRSSRSVSFAKIKSVCIIAEGPIPVTS